MAKSELRKRLDELKVQKVLDAYFNSVSALSSLRVVGFKEIADTTQVALKQTRPIEVARYDYLTDIETMDFFHPKVIAWVRQEFESLSEVSDYLLKFTDTYFGHTFIPWLHIQFTSYEWIEPIWLRGGAIALLTMAEDSTLSAYGFEGSCFVERKILKPGASET